MHKRIFRSCIQQEHDILSRVKPSSREDVVSAMEMLAECLQAQMSLCQCGVTESCEDTTSHLTVTCPHV